MLLCKSELYLFRPAEVLQQAANSYAVKALASWGKLDRASWDGMLSGLLAALGQAGRVACRDHAKEVPWADIVAAVHDPRYRSFLELLTKPADGYQPTEWHPEYLLRSVEALKSRVVTFQNNTQHLVR